MKIEEKSMGNQIQSPNAQLPWVVMCVGAVVIRENKVLLVRQAAGHPLEGQWSIPWGFLDRMESPDIAALRETQEEGGIHAKVEGMLGLQDLQQEGWLAIIFLCRHVSGVPEHDGGRETDAAEYFSLKEMDAFEEPFETWCEWILRRVLTGNYRVTPYVRENPYHPKSAYF